MRAGRTLLIIAAASLLAGCASGSGGSAKTVTVGRAEHARAAAPPSTTAPAPAVAARPRPHASAFRHCDDNISAKATTTTCAWAENAFYEFYVRDGSDHLRVYSPAAHSFFDTSCSTSDGLVSCSTSDGGVARFAQAAIDRYTSDEARVYAATADLGPTSASHVTSPPTHTSPPDQASAKVCYPGFTVPAVTIPGTTIPATTIPAMDIGGTHYPAQHYPAQHYPAQHYPAQHYAGQCFTAPESFAPSSTSELAASAYRALDPDYSPTLTQRYWSETGSSVDYPDPTAPGFGEVNGAGFPKNQYVRPYVRRDGTAVSGYWRNSPSDGLPTCHIISC